MATVTVVAVEVVAGVVGLLINETHNFYLETVTGYSNFAPVTVRKPVSWWFWIASAGEDPKPWYLVYWVPIMYVLCISQYFPFVVLPVDDRSNIL